MHRNIRRSTIRRRSRLVQHRRERRLGPRADLRRLCRAERRPGARRQPAALQYRRPLRRNPPADRRLRLGRRSAQFAATRTAPVRCPRPARRRRQSARRLLLSERRQLRDDQHALPQLAAVAERGLQRLRQCGRQARSVADDDPAEPELDAAGRELHLAVGRHRQPRQSGARSVHLGQYRSRLRILYWAADPISRSPPSGSRSRASPSTATSRCRSATSPNMASPSTR